MELVINGEKIVVSQIKKYDGSLSFVVDDVEYSYQLSAHHHPHMILSDGENSTHSLVGVGSDRKHGHVVISNRDYFIEEVKSGTRVSSESNLGEMISPMPGKIFKILKKVGDEVKASETILIMEAMKMEHAIKAPVDGKIEEMPYNEGDLVDGGVELVRLKIKENSDE